MEETENNTSAEVLQQKVDSFFEANPKTKSVLQTADGFLFTNKYFACKHAETLEGTVPVVFKNPAFLEVVAEEVKAPVVPVVEPIIPKV